MRKHKSLSPITEIEKKLRKKTRNRIDIKYQKNAKIFTLSCSVRKKNFQVNSIKNHIEGREQLINKIIKELKIKI